MQFIPVLKAEFSASLLQSSVSYADLLLKKHFLLLINVENVVLRNIFV